MERESIQIRTASIRLDGFLKFAGAVGTGGEAKHLIQAGFVRVNGEPELRRRRRIVPGDRVELLAEEGAVVVSLEVRGP